MPACQPPEATSPAPPSATDGERPAPRFPGRRTPRRGAPRPPPCTPRRAPPARPPAADPSSCSAALAPDPHAPRGPAPAARGRTPRSGPQELKCPHGRAPPARSLPRPRPHALWRSEPGLPPPPPPPPSPPPPPPPQGPGRPASQSQRPQGSASRSRPRTSSASSALAAAPGRARRQDRRTARTSNRNGTRRGRADGLLQRPIGSRAPGGRGYRQRTAPRPCFRWGRGGEWKLSQSSSELPRTRGGVAAGRRGPAEGGRGRGGGWGRAGPHPLPESRRLPGDLRAAVPAPSGAARRRLPLLLVLPAAGVCRGRADRAAARTGRGPDAARGRPGGSTPHPWGGARRRSPGGRPPADKPGARAAPPPARRVICWRAAPARGRGDQGVPGSAGGRAGGLHAPAPRTRARAHGCARGPAAAAPAGAGRPAVRPAGGAAGSRARGLRGAGRGHPPALRRPPRAPGRAGLSGRDLGHGHRGRRPRLQAAAARGRLAGPPGLRALPAGQRSRGGLPQESRLVGGRVPQRPPHRSPQSHGSPWTFPP